MQHFHPAKLHKRRGQALVVAILVLMVLTASAIAISAAARLELRAARRGVEQVRRDAALRGAVNRGLALLEQGRADPETLLQNLRTYGTLRWTPMDAADPGDPNQDPVPMMMAIQIVDASSRLDLMNATSEQLRKLPELERDRETPQAILDWRDKDEGEDDKDYLNGPRPYRPKDRPYDSLEELLLVNGVDRGLFFGPPSIQQALELKVPPLSEFLTVLSGENNADYAGNMRVDVNNADAETLLEAANRERTLLTDPQIQRIIARREQHALQIENGTLQPGQSRKAFPGIFEAISESGAPQEAWGTLLDVWTTDPREFLPGRVNVNTASEEVLETLTGLSGEMRNELLSRRQQKPEGLDWQDMISILGIQSQNSQVQGGNQPPNQPPGGGQNPQQQQQQQQQQGAVQVLEQITVRSAAYYVRCLVREGTSSQITAASVLVYWPADSSEAAKIVQWRQPDKFPGWTAWFRTPEW